MAILSSCASGRRIWLCARHVFGRDRAANTVLDGPDASRLHASVHWTGGAWDIRDHSRNGTLVDGVRIAPGKSVRLRTGSLIAFGRDRAAVWRVEDLARPCALLWPLDGGEAIPLAPSNLLPEGAAAEFTVFLSAGGRWVCTGPRGTHDLEDGDELHFGSRAWVFLSGVDGTSTVDGDAPAAPPFLEFRVSLDEEHAWLTLAHEGRAFDLGERSHHYALLTLARLRLADAARGLEPAGQGWIEHERLARMLGLDPQHLNIQVFRLRKQIALALPRERPVPELIERRRGALRLGSLAFRILRGSELQGSFDPFDATIAGREEPMPA